MYNHDCIYRTVPPDTPSLHTPAYPKACATTLHHFRSSGMQARVITQAALKFLPHQQMIEFIYFLEENPALCSDILIGTSCGARGRKR